MQRSLSIQIGEPMLNILLVDDDPSDAELIRLTLTRQIVDDLRVVNAFSCTEACFRIQVEGVEAFDCIVMDQKMPGATGSECISRLRSAEFNYQGAFVLLTGFADNNIAFDAMQRGADDFLNKDDMEVSLVPAILAAIQAREFIVRDTHTTADRIARIDGLVAQLDGVLKRLKLHRRC